jgi:hypothetical protein
VPEAAGCKQEVHSRDLELDCSQVEYRWQQVESKRGLYLRFGFLDFLRALMGSSRVHSEVGGLNRVTSLKKKDLLR